MYQRFGVFYLMGCIALALAGIWRIAHVCRGGRRAFKASRVAAAILAAAAVCTLAILYVRPRMSQSVYHHMAGLLLWCAAALLFYKCYCESSDIDTNPIAYIRLLIAPVMAGLCFLFWPWVESSDSLSRQNGLQVLLQSVHYAWRTFTLENSFEEFWAGLSAFENLTAWDRTYVSVLVVLAPILTLTMALSFFTVPVFVMKLLLLRGRRVYIFSALNDRAVRYAQAVQDADGSRRGAFRKPLIAFCADQDQGENTAPGALNAVIFRRGIEHLHFIRIARKRRVCFYLVSNDDNLNIQQAERLRGKYKNKCRICCVAEERINEAKIDELNAAIGGKANGDLTGRISGRLIIKTKRPPNAPPAGQAQVLFYESGNDRQTIFGKEAEKIRSSGIEAVSEARQALFTELYERPLLNAELLKAIEPADGRKTARVLILGGGVVGAELARICLWYCQLPDTAVEVTVADAVSDRALRSRVLRSSINIRTENRADADRRPAAYDDTFEESQIHVLGYQAAALRTWGETDFETDDILARIDRQAAPFHIVFVCTGDDDLNYQLSVRLRRYYLRKSEAWGCPSIRTIIRNDTMAKLVNPDKHRALSGIGCADMFYRGYDKNPPEKYNAECRVEIFGSMLDSVWKYERLLFIGLCCHAFYSGDEVSMRYPVAMKRDTVRSYFLGPERNRRSSMALAIHGKCKEEWRKYRGESASEEALARAEHTRWCVYELLEGYVTVPNGCEDKYFNADYQKENRDTDEVRGYHAVLTSWNRLEELAKAAPADRKRTSAVLWNEWTKALANNASIVRFSHSLEKAFGRDQREGQN